MDDLESEMGIQETRKKLKRELRAEAMTRLEEAARTEADFENVVKCWDKLDENRERKERYHEVGRSGVPLEYGSAYGGSIFPAWMGGPNSRAIRQGRFLDVIFNCPHELHQMVGHQALSKTFRELDAEYKELLFFPGGSELVGAVLRPSSESDRPKCTQEDDPAGKQNPGGALQPTEWKSESEPDRKRIPG